jgi:hypothetical protein
MNKPRSTISPKQLEVLLQAHYLAGPLELTGPAHKEAVEFFSRAEIIKPVGTRPGCWELTEKGTAWIEAILAVPVPVSKTIWVIPGAPDAP